jgi:hypothetical protein
MVGVAATCDVVSDNAKLALNIKVIAVFWPLFMEQLLPVILLAETSINIFL